MNTKQIVKGVSVATILALASPVFAGQLVGGAGGGFGGALGGLGVGAAGGLGGAFGGGVGGFGGSGGFTSQNGIDGSLKTPRPHAVNHAAGTVDSKTAAAAQATQAPAAMQTDVATQTAAAMQTATSAAGDARWNAGKDSANTVSTSHAPAAKPMTSAPAKSTSGTSRSAPAPAPSSMPASPRDSSASLTGANSETAREGNRNVSGTGAASIDASRSPGSNSVGATGAASQNGSLN